MTTADSRIDRLLDAIDLVKEDRIDEARDLLRTLVHEDNDFEAAWLWLSLTVDSLDQSSLCLDNVLRINPSNDRAALALARLQAEDMVDEKQRRRLRSLRDGFLMLFWLLAGGILLALFLWFMAGMQALG